MVPSVSMRDPGEGFKARRIAELRAEVPEVGPVEARRLQQGGAALIDVREPDEVADGTARGALPLGRGFLELRIEEAVPDPATTVVLMCAGGTRSLFAADGLRRLGYRDVRSLAGGFSQWKAEGLPIEVPRTLDADARARYSRHLRIPEVGEAGQRRLLDSRVLLVGAGGLGSPAALYLAAAGVGTLGLIDDDVVDRSNLQRQVLHTDARVGTAKVASAAQTLNALNPAITIRTHSVRLVPDNVEAIFGDYQIVVDGADNFGTRYLINDACVRLGLPNVHGSVYRFEGQVGVFWPGRPELPGPCYRCLYAAPPPPELAPSCAEAGVLGVLPGVIGLLQAVETLKLLLGLGDPLVGRLLQYDALSAEFTDLRIPRDPECRVCGEGAVFTGYAAPDAGCAVG